MRILYLLGLAGSILYGVLAVLTWRRRSHPVVAALFYYAGFTCALDVPLKLLYWFFQHPAAYKAYYYIYWTLEPLSDLLALFVGYQFICHFCDSAMLRRFALGLFGFIAFTTTGLLLLFLASPSGPHLTLKAWHLFVMECCLHLALCAIVLVLVVFRNSLGLSAEPPMMLIALGLGIMAASSLISSTLIVFVPHAYRVGNFAVLGCIEMVGAQAGIALWCFALLKLRPAEDAALAPQWPALALPLNRLDTECDLLMEIMKR